MKITKHLNLIIICILISANLCFIWGNSLLDKTESGQVSSEVTEIVRPIFEPIFGNELFSGSLIRKLAHFVEFGILGGLLSLLMNILDSKYGIRRKSMLPYLILFGLVAAMIDETIQIFTERGSQVSDVWLDFAGVLSGFLLIHFMYCFMQKIHRAKKVE